MLPRSFSGPPTLLKDCAFVLNQASRSLSERPVGYLLAIIGGTACFPLGWIASPLVLFILNKQMKPKDGRTPNRFLVWTLRGIAAVPANLIGTTLVLAPLVNSLIETNVKGCNNGSIEACKTLLDQPDVHSRVTNPRFATLREEAKLARERQERAEREQVRREAQEMEQVMQKQKEAERAKVLARIQEREQKQADEKARVQAENQEKYRLKLMAWAKSSDPWIGCMVQLKRQLRDPDSYNDDWARPEPTVKDSMISYIWQFRSKNGFGGYESALAVCETTPDTASSSGDWGGYGLPKVSFLQGQ